MPLSFLPLRRRAARNEKSVPLRRREAAQVARVDQTESSDWWLGPVPLRLSNRASSELLAKAPSRAGQDSVTAAREQRVNRGDMLNESLSTFGAAAGCQGGGEARAERAAIRGVRLGNCYCRASTPIISSKSLPTAVRSASWAFSNSGPH
jgi:hypothetical protein